MIIRAVILGIEQDGLQDLERLFTYAASSDFLEEYAAWDDTRFMSRFGVESKPESLCAQLLERLRLRQLHKQVYSEGVDSFPDGQVREDLLALDEREDDATRRELEAAIACVVGKQLGQTVDPRLTIVHGYDIKSARATSGGDEGDIMVECGPKPPTMFEQESPLFSSISSSYAKAYVAVYAPVTWETPADRQRIRDSLRSPIKEVINSVCGNGSQGGG